MKAFFNRMNKRERTLAMIIGGILLLLVVFTTVNMVLQKQSTLRSQLETKKSELKSLEILAEERDTWAKREMWLEQAQPKLISQSGVGVALLDEVKKIAKEHGVILESPELGLLDTKDYYLSMPVKVQTKSSWKSLVEFLEDLQAPDRFVAIENVEIEVDAEDKSQMHGTFRIARWYAPRE